MQTKILQLVNILLIVVNGIIFVMPKKPVSNMQSNAAGMMIMIAIGIGVLYIAHIILLSISMYYNKPLLLRVLTVIAVPLSMAFWYFMYRTIN